jgi:hypothetical protein
MMQALALFCTLIGAVLGPLMFSLARTLTTRALRSDYVLNLHAPIGANPSLGLFPLHSNQIVIGAAVAAPVVAVLTVLFIALYPASQKLANRLAILAIGTAVLAAGVMAPVADLALVRALSRWKGLSEIASMGAVAAVIGVALMAIIWLERHVICLLGNLFEVDTPARRLRLWAIRVPLPWGLFAGTCTLADWWGGVIASAGIVVVTLVDDLVHYPARRYESLDHPKMYEGVTAAAIVAIVLGGASAFSFGLPAARLVPRAIVIDSGSVTRVPVSDLTYRIQEETMPRMKMQWSEEK